MSYTVTVLHRTTGVYSFDVQSEKQAMNVLSGVIHNELIERLDVDLTTGRISWIRTPEQSPNHDERNKCCKRIGKVIRVVTQQKETLLYVR